MSVTVKFKKLRPGAIIPQYMTAGAAGMDVFAFVEPEGVAVWPGRRLTVGTGIAIGVPSGYEAQLRPRSGIARDYGVTLTNSPATIDSDYTGEVRVMLVNHGEVPFNIDNGDRVAQLVIAPVVRADVVEVDDLSATERGAGGFGSTGK